MLATRSHLLAALLLGLVGSSLVAGCGAAPSGAAAPAPAVVMPAREEGGSPEAALAAVDEAERAIGQLLGPQQGSVAGQAAAAPAQPLAAPPLPPPPPPPASQPAQAPVAPSGRRAADAQLEKQSDRKYAEAPKGAPASQGDTCTTACAALASMARAADHLCGLAGAADARCTGARDRVKNASLRVHASCPSC